jgi:Uma2 family endonuclease
MASVATALEIEILSNLESDLPVKPKPLVEAAPEIKLWTVEEFANLLGTDLLGGDSRYELLDGVIFKKMGQNESHALSILLVADALRLVFGSEFNVNQQLPVFLGPNTKPEPDIVVFRGSARSYASSFPQTSDIALLVEVVDTRQDTARNQKVPLYAAAGIPEYWIVDLKRKVLEVRRGPIIESQEWTETRIYSPTESLQPLEGTQGFVSVNDLFPQIEEETA